MQRVVRDLGVGQAESRRVYRDHLEARDALVRLVASGQGESDAALALRWQIARALEPFVAQRARRLARRDPEGAADLTQTALADLAAAAHTWDPSLGALTTWGQWRLRPILDRAAAVQLGEAAPRVGRAYHQAVRQVDGLRSLGDSLEDACATSKISPAAYQAARDAARPAVRLDAPVPGGEEGDVRQIDRLTDGSDPEAAILAGIERAAVREAIETLADRDRQIVEARLDGQTYAQICAALGLSRERVRQIVQAALQQIRARLGIVPPARERQQAGAREGTRRRRARTLERVESFQANPETPRERCWIVDAGVACTRRVDRRGLCESHAQIAARHGRLEALSRPREGGGRQSGWPKGAALWRTESGARGGRTSAVQRRARADARIATWIPDPEAPRQRCWLIDAGVACEAPVARRGLCGRHSRALDRAGPEALARLSRPRKSPESAGPVRPPPAALPSSAGEGPAAARSAAPVEARVEPPAVAVAAAERTGRGLPAPEPPATAEGQPTSTPDPRSQPMSRSVTLPLLVDPEAPEGRCRLEGCIASVHVRGLCLGCYDKARRRGCLDRVALPPTPRGARYRGQRVGVPTTESAPTTPQARRARSTSRPEIAEALQAVWAALGSPSGLSPSEPLELLRATELRLRLQSQLASRITELEEEAVRLLARIGELEGEATVAQRARTRALEERAGLICSLLEALGGAPAAPRSQEDLVEDLVTEVRRLRASEERDPDCPSLSRGSVAFLAGFLALPESATSEEVLREIARLQDDCAIRAEDPESLERRYQALQTARRLRALLEGRAETRVQLPTGEIVGLQEIWLWDLLAPLLPGEIERLEREAGVSRG